MDASTASQRRLHVRHAAGRVILAGLLAVLTSGPALAQDPGASAPGRWQRAELPVVSSGIQLWDVIAGGPGFIAVGGGFMEGREVGSAVILVSDDGRTWQSVPLFGEAGEGIPRSLAETADGFVAVGSGCCPDVAAVWLSPDGLVWERLPEQPGFTDSAMIGVTSTVDGLVAVGCRAVLECFGGLAWTSPDGRTWREPVELDLLPLGVASTTAGVLATGSSQAYGGDAAVSSSIDGSTWSSATSVETGGVLHAVTITGDGVLAVGGTTLEPSGRSDTLAFSSPDATTWEPSDVPGLRGVWVEDVVTAPSGWLFVGWTSGRSGQRPATLWTTDLEQVRTLRFMRETKEGGLLHAAAISEDGLTLVAVGSTVLNRGEVPTVWVRSVPGKGSP